MNSRLVAAIIPAFNEEPTIAGVVQVLKSSPFVSEVIVISDGSTDRTAEAARIAGATVYEKENGGKGQAMLFGLAHTSAPLILFCDADLRGLTVRHVEQLLSPVVNGSLAMHIGRRDRGGLLNSLSAFLPLISGERVLERTVLERVPADYLSGYMIESTLNYFCRSRHLPYGSVLLRGLTMRRKYEKFGWGKGLRQYFKMTTQVLRAMITVRVARLLGKF